MDVKTGLLILAQLPLAGLVIYWALHEDALLAAEKAVRRNIARTLRAVRTARELRRREKLNKKALYVPVRPPERSEAHGRGAA